MHRYLPHMQAEQQQAVACTRHIRASVEKKDLRKPEFPVPRKWLVGERSDNVVTAQMDGCFQSYVFQCGNKIIWDFSTYGERQTADVSLAGAGTYRLFFLKSIARFLHKFEGTLILFYKQRFISNDFPTSLFLKKIKQQTSIFSKN